MYNQRNRSNPSSDVIVRRFFREVQQNRVLSEAKKRRFRERELTRTEKRSIARRKSYVRKRKRGY